MKEHLFAGNRRFLFSVLAAFLVFGAVAAHAHKVTVFAWAEGDQVFTESKLSGGKHVSGGEITVYDASGNILLKGKTDDQGEFAFTLPQPPPLIVELNAGMGHQARWTLRPEDMDADAVPAGNDSHDAPGPPDPAVNTRPAEITGETGTAVLEATIEKVMDRKLKPVIRMIADTRQDAPTFSDVIGGIGYIMGIVGLVAYFKGKEQKKKED